MKQDCISDFITFCVLSANAVPTTVLLKEMCRKCTLAAPLCVLCVEFKSQSVLSRSAVDYPVCVLSVYDFIFISPVYNHRDMCELGFHHFSCLEYPVWYLEWVWEEEGHSNDNSLNEGRGCHRNSAISQSSHLATVNNPHLLILLHCSVLQVLQK
jgi:hypothetical protein